LSLFSADVCPVSYVFFRHTATTEIYTLSLHDALPIFAHAGIIDLLELPDLLHRLGERRREAAHVGDHHLHAGGVSGSNDFVGLRSEEHTSELQSRENLVCRLLLEKKKTESTGGHARQE